MMVARLMRVIAHLFGVALVALVCVAPAQAGRLNWGIESWQCGDSWFKITAGDGSDIYLTGVSGVVSAAINPLAISSTRMRQALVVLTYLPQAWNDAVGQGAIVSSPDAPRYQNEINANLYAINVKQEALDVVHIPFNVTFPEAVRIPAGQLQMLVSTVTYDGTTTITDQPGECLDTEAHLSLYWRLTP